MFESHLKKMSVTHHSPIHYALTSASHTLALNDFLDKKIKLEFLNTMQCIQCDRKITKTFQQGYCYPCMQKINECNNCMIFPERCLVEQGGCNAADWAHGHCHQDHVVYLANSSGLKVGITRTTNMPSRWIDQGATQALPIFKTSNRYQAGLIEVILKKYIADKTNWRVMLKGNIATLDLQTEKKSVMSLAKKELNNLLEKYQDEITELKNECVSFEYPVIQYPEKITALSLDKTPMIEGMLLGIKGQYLLLDSGVLNIRKFGGYLLKWSV